MRCDEARSGRSPHRGATSGRLKWTFAPETPFFAESDPLIGRDETLVFAGTEMGTSDAHHVYAVASDGDLRWRYAISSRTCELGIDADGNVYFGTEEGIVHAIDADGDQRWTYDIGHEVCAAPLIGDSTLYLGAIDGALYALSLRGALHWLYAAEGPIATSAALGSDGAVHIGDSAGVLHALDSAGKSRWQVSLGEPIRGPLAVGKDGTVYALARGDLHAVDLQGTWQWSVHIGEIYSTQAPALSPDGTIYINGDGGQLVAVTPQGQIEWRKDLDGPGPFIYPEGIITVGPPIVDRDGTIYHGYRLCCVGMGQVTALWPDGTERWVFDSYGVIRSLAIARDGTTYALTDGELYALE